MRPGCAEKTLTSLARRAEPLLSWALSRCVCPFPPLSFSFSLLFAVPGLDIPLTRSSTRSRSLENRSTPFKRSRRLIARGRLPLLFSCLFSPCFVYLFLLIFIHSSLEPATVSIALFNKTVPGFIARAARNCNLLRLPLPLH